MSVTSCLGISMLSDLQERIECILQLCCQAQLVTVQQSDSFIICIL